MACPETDVGGDQKQDYHLGWPYLFYCAEITKIIVHRCDQRLQNHTGCVPKISQIITKIIDGGRINYINRELIPYF